MTTNLDTLATALYVRTDDLLKESPQLALCRPEIGIGPELSDAELVTLAVMQAIAGWRIKTVPSRLFAVDLARLRSAGARPAGPPPAGPAPGPLAASSCVEVQRLVNAAGIINLGNQVIQVGSPLAGQRNRIRLDGQVMHVITQDGILWRTLPCPIPPASATGSKASDWPVPPPCPKPLQWRKGGCPPGAASRSPIRRSRSA